MTRSVSRSVVVDAPASAVFALLADPRRHADFDGSGTVRSAVRGPSSLKKGDRFGMKMKLGVPYTITNEVVELEPDAVIAWRHIGHHVWRYDLEPVEGGTKVTETFDWSTARVPKAMELLGYPAKNAVSMEKTLVRLKELTERS